LRRRLGGWEEDENVVGIDQRQGFVGEERGESVRDEREEKGA